MKKNHGNKKIISLHILLSLRGLFARSNLIKIQIVSLHYVPLAMTVIFFYPTLCAAQFSADSSNFPIPGSAYERLYAIDFTDSIGVAGANIAYNFSNAKPVKSDTIKYTSAATTGFASNHPGAQVSQYFPGDIKWYEFYTSDTLAYWKSGLTLIADFTGDTIPDTLHANHLPPDTDTLISSEYVFGHVETESSVIQVDVTPSVYARLFTFKNISVDGWGSLKTPTVFYDSVLRVKYTEYKYDSIFITGSYSPGDSKFDTLYYYHYLSKNLHHPAVIAHTDMNDRIQYLEMLNLPPLIAGCTDTSAQNYNPLANSNDGSCTYCQAIPYFITPDVNLCKGDTATLSVSGGKIWKWSSGDTTASIKVFPDTSASYSVYISDSGVCWEMANVKVTINDSVKSSFAMQQASPTTADSILFINTSIGTASYKWDFGDATTSTETNPKHKFQTSGTITVTLISYNSCFSDTFRMNINVVTEVAEHGTALMDPRFLIFPNPSHGEATARFTLIKPTHAKLVVTDLQGRTLGVVLNEHYEQGEYEAPLVLGQSVASGVYLIILHTDEGIYHRKLIINKGKGWE